MKPNPITPIEPTQLRTRSALWPALIVAVSLTACAAPSCETAPSHVGKALAAGLNRQVLHPEGPADRSPVDGLSGELAAQIYKKHYLKSMTEKETQNAEKASQEFR
jgi:hypothetical protein